MRQPIVLHVRHLPTAGSSSQMPHVQGEPCSGDPVENGTPAPLAPSQRQLYLRRLAVGTLHLPQLHLRPSVPAAPCTCSNCTRGFLHLPRQLDLWQPADGNLRRLPSAGYICRSCRRQATSAAACRPQATSAVACRRQPASAAPARAAPCGAGNASVCGDCTVHTNGNRVEQTGIIPGTAAPTF